jgi:hypothetical protein
VVSLPKEKTSLKTLLRAFESRIDDEVREALLEREQEIREERFE